MRGGVIRFRNEEVEVATNSLEMVFDGNCPSDLGISLYVYLRDLWISTRGNYRDSLRKRQLTVRQSNVSHAIAAALRESQGKSGIYVRGKSELTQGLLRGYQGGKGWGF